MRYLLCLALLLCAVPAEAQTIRGITLTAITGGNITDTHVLIVDNTSGTRKLAFPEAKVALNISPSSALTLSSGTLNAITLTQNLGIGGNPSGIHRITLTTNSTFTTGLSLNMSNTTHLPLRITLSAGTVPGTTQGILVESSTGAIFYRMMPGDFVMDSANPSFEIRQNGTANYFVSMAASPASGGMLTFASGAGTATRAPIVILSTTLKSSLVNGAFGESNGTNFFGTLSGTRGVIITGTHSVAPTTTNAGVPTVRYGGDTNYMGEPSIWLRANVNGTNYVFPGYLP